MSHPIPVTLLTGFLGSGKTTLLNALLKHEEMARTAVVVNEFGEIGLDHDLIEAARDQVVLLPSGCLCCSVRGDLATTLAQLRERRSAGHIAFERIVIEMTGLADPAPVVQMLALDPELTNDFKLDGVITTADAATGTHSLATQFEAVQQVAMADRIVLTKTDLVTPAQRATFEAQLTAINPYAARLVATDGAISPAKLFGLAPEARSDKTAALDWVGTKAPLPALSDVRVPQTHQTQMAPQHGTAHSGRISSQSVELTQPVEPIAFDLWLDQVMNGAGTELLRLKAVIHVRGMDHPFALHAVQQIVHPPVALTQWPTDDTTSRVVVIGRDLEPGFLTRNVAVLSGGARDE